MKLQEGVDLHFIPTNIFNTNQIKIRFAAPASKETIASRVLVANLLEIANRDYPSAQLLRRQLASLYGATLTTTVNQRGKMHFIDLTVTYIQKKYIPNQLDLTGKIIDLLEATLFRPIATKAAFELQHFEVEKKNLLVYLEAEIEDNFYHADVELNQLFYQDEDVKVPKIGTIDLVKKETPQSTYKTYQNMLLLDKIDIFVLGKVDEEVVTKRLTDFQFSYRKPKLTLEYHQEWSSITKQKIEKKQSQQSILEMGYHFPKIDNVVKYAALVLFNGMLGEASHSKLFVQLREQEGLAYSIGSMLHIDSGLLRIYAGIHKENRLKTMRLIRKQFLDMRQGKFTDEELELTKKGILQAATIAQDNPSTLVEQMYNQIILKEKYISFTEWMDIVNKVSREDVVRASNTLKLQAVYFMEGEVG